MEVQSVDIRNRKMNTGISTHSFNTFKSVFSGTLIFFAASSNKAILSVRGFPSSFGMFFVDV